jgi:hypothetical protein
METYFGSRRINKAIVQEYQMMTDPQAVMAKMGHMLDNDKNRSVKVGQVGENDRNRSVNYIDIYVGLDCSVPSTTT